MFPYDQLARDLGYFYDSLAATRAVKFIETFCRQSKGDFAGQKIKLLAWQKEFIERLFGWKRLDGTRRYRHASVWVAKKNGKSTLASAIALYCLVADHENGAEVYSIANDQQQASIVFGESANMVEQSPNLAKKLTVLRSQKKIFFPSNKSIYRALSSEKAGKHGYNASCLIWDEIAFQPDRELWDVLRYSTAFRKQPLTISISTAGYDREGIGFEQYSYAKKVKNSQIEDIHFLPVIYEADLTDDWTTLATAQKANPSFGHTIHEQDFIESINEAKAEPRKEANYKCLRLNLWVGHQNAWLRSEDWQACGESFDPTILEKKDCYVGLDLARKHDLASYVLVFPLNNLYYLLPRFFIPKDLALRKQDSDKVPYFLWERQGLITFTDGNVIDYSYIRQAIKEDSNKYNIVELGYDPYQAELLCNQQLRQEDGINTVEVRQGILTMGQPTAQFERLLKEKRIRHNSHPILSWNSQNVIVREDANQNIMPDKRNSTSRIDGITSAIIGLSRTLFADTSSFEGLILC